MGQSLCLIKRSKYIGRRPRDGTLLWPGLPRSRRGTCSRRRCTLWRFGSCSALRWRRTAAWTHTSTSFGGCTKSGRSCPASGTLSATILPRARSILTIFRAETGTSDFTLSTTRARLLRTSTRWCWRACTWAGPRSAMCWRGCGPSGSARCGGSITRSPRRLCWWC